MLPRKIIPLAWRNLTENKRRLAASVAGTAFAVTLMFMENGFRHAMLDSMVNLIERLDGEVVIISRTLYSLAVPYHSPIAGLSRQGTSPGDRRQPRLRGDPAGYWRNPRDGSLDRICVIGVPPESDVLDLERVRQHRQALSEPDTVLADELSRSSRFGHFVPGEDLRALRPPGPDRGHIQARDQRPVQRQPDHQRPQSPQALSRARWRDRG